MRISAHRIYLSRKFLTSHILQKDCKPFHDIKMPDSYWTEEFMDISSQPIPCILVWLFSLMFWTTNIVEVQQTIFYWFPFFCFDLSVPAHHIVIEFVDSFIKHSVESSSNSILFSSFNHILFIYLILVVLLCNWHGYFTSFPNHHDSNLTFYLLIRSMKWTPLIQWEHLYINHLSHLILPSLFI